MEIPQVVKECAYYGVAIGLSCGPSQAYGLIKGAIDCKRLYALRSKIHQWKEIESLCVSKRFDELKATRAFKVISREAGGQPEEVLFKRLLEKAKDRIFDLQQKQDVRTTSILKDVVSLIPLIGAVFAWRIGAGECGKKLSMAPVLEHIAAHMSDNYKTFAQKQFYPMSREPGYVLKENHVNISVDSRGGHLDAIFLEGHNAKPTDPAVVIFHGNMCTCQDMVGIGQWYVSQGYNVLIPTLGGYAGSPGVTTSEASSYQDVESIKKFLESRGITKAGYHGLSIGGTLAFQAAIGNSEANVETLFLVADQTLRSAAKVAENVINPLAKSIAKKLRMPVLESVTVSIARGVMRTAFPKRKVRLSDTLVVKTDGLDNLRKARLMRSKNIPMIAIRSSQDSLMGKNYKDRKFQQNFAEEILLARYDSNNVRKFLIEVDGSHGIDFRVSKEAKERLQEFLSEIKDK